MNEEIYDAIIVGAGPAGMSAGIYGARAGLKAVILEKGLPGGIAGTTDLIENYPGFPGGINGMKLVELMRKQCEGFGAEIHNVEVKSIVKSNDEFKIKTSRDDYTARTVIIASGSYHKRLNVPGEKELYGKGASYCATCDGPLFKNRDVAVVGCGNSGLQEGRFLLNFAKSITFVEFLPYITADKILQEQFRNEPRANFFLNQEVISINGENRVESLTFLDRNTKERHEIKVDGVFIYVGLLPNSNFVKDFVTLDKDGFIITNDNLETSVSGVFAAGDIRAKKYRQVVIACSEGAIAALGAYHYLADHKKKTI